MRSDCKSDRTKGGVVTRSLFGKLPPPVSPSFSALNNLGELVFRLSHLGELGHRDRCRSFQAQDMRARGHKTALVGVVNVTVFVFLRSENDDIVDVPTVDVGAAAREIEAKLRRLAWPFLHVESKQVLALRDAALHRVFPDALPILAVLGNSDADLRVDFALCGF